VATFIKVIDKNLVALEAAAMLKLLVQRIDLMQILRKWMKEFKNPS
jgi:hypothetical protein